MNDMLIHQRQQTTLAAALRTLWERTHGTPAGQVHVLSRTDNLVVRMENVLNPAERFLSQTAEGKRLVWSYIEQLLNILQLDMRACVETITGCEVMTSCLSFDVDANHVLCFFALDE
jgi:uncharacterized protein YbcI